MTADGDVSDWGDSVFKALGLTREQEAFYRHVVRVPQATVAEIVTAAGLTAGSGTRIADELKALGFVTVAADGCIMAIPPRLAMEPILADRLAEIERARQEIWRLGEVYSAHQPAEPSVRRLVDVLPSSDVVSRALHGLHISARKDIRVFDKRIYIRERTRSEVNDNELDALARGVRCRAIYAREALEEPSAVEHLDTYIRAGEQARVVADLPLKMFIADDDVAVVMYAVPTSDGYTALLMHRSPLIAALIELFEMTWRLAIPVQSDPEGSDAIVGVTDEDRHLAALLAAGLKEETIGRQLGVSERTVQRRVRHLLDRFHVRSRQQLLLTFAQRGWLSPDDAPDDDPPGG